MTTSVRRANVVSMGELDVLLGEIAHLLAQAARDDDPARLERTLTDGYARALTLETERERLRRQIGQVTSSLERGEPAEAAKLRTLRRRLTTQSRKLDHLRDELGRLRLRHSVAVRGGS
jgi:hypothetical protein